MTLEDGTAAGQITSAAELPLAAGRRVFALGMIKSDAEAGAAAGAETRSPVFNYKVGAIAGTARILAAPPKLSKKRA